MNKEEHIKYWLDSANEDYDVINYLVQGKKYVYALFFGHLYLEKISEAIWVKNNESNYPPKIHNLLTILKQANVTLEDDQSLFLLKMNQYQIEGRYPEDIEKLKNITDAELTEKSLNNINNIAKCLLKHLQ